MKKGSRIIIDTNLWISIALGKRIDDFIKEVIENDLALIYSKELLNEIRNVFNKEKIRKFVLPGTVNKVINYLKEFGNEVTAISAYKICRDPKDDFLISLCKDGQADYLITGDNDLLSLRRFEKTSIVTYSTFFKK